jgi:signal transduction histidine kinase
MIIVNQVNTTYDKTEKSVEKINAKINQVNTTYNKTEKSVKKIDAKMDKVTNNGKIYTEIQQLNTTLISIQTFLFYLELDLSRNEPLDEKYIVFIRDNAKYIEECVKDIRSIKRNDSIKHIIERTEKLFPVCIDRIQYLKEKYKEKLSNSLDDIQSLLQTTHKLIKNNNTFI